MYDMQVYAGFSLSHGGVSEAIQESIISSGFMYLSAYLLEKQIDIKPEYIGLGIILHGVYDLSIHFNVMPYTKHAPQGYALACAVADIIMGSVGYYLWKKP